MFVAFSLQMQVNYLTCCGTRNFSQISSDDEMEERGRLIRKELPSAFREVPGSRHTLTKKSLKLRVGMVSVVIEPGSVLLQSFVTQQHRAFM